MTDQQQQSPLYVFRYGNFEFEFQAGSLSCLNHTPPRTAGGKSAPFRDFLPKFLASYDPQTKCGEMEAKTGEALNSQKTQVNSLRKTFSEITGVPDFGSTIIPRRQDGGPFRMLIDSLTVKGPQISDDLLAEDRRQNEMIALAEPQIPLLMDLLVELYPFLDGFFFKTNSGVRLPFFEMTPERFGTPNWPLPIHDDVVQAPKRKHSLKDQRWREKAKLYNGNIYRLVKADKEYGWSLGKAKYFDILDSCDILRVKILTDFGSVLHLDHDSQKNALSQSPWVNEWLRNVKAVMTGDFSGFVAGMATNMPLFYNDENGNLALVLAQGSNDKAAGHGKLHVMPAGMIEFYKNTLSSKLPFESYRTILTKELYEEAFKHKSILNENIYDALEGNFLDHQHESDFPEQPPEGCPGGWNNAFLEGLFNEAEAGMQLKGETFPPLALSRKIRSLPEDTLTFQIVDAFRLRPEIIVPVKLNFAPSVALSWEYHPSIPDHHVFTSLSALDSYVEKNLQRWAEPGLAAAYLGARAIFTKKL